jgi:hypothetical protein
LHSFTAYLNSDGSELDDGEVASGGGDDRNYGDSAEGDEGVDRGRKRGGEDEGFIPPHRDHGRRRRSGSLSSVGSSVLSKDFVGNGRDKVVRGRSAAQDISNSIGKLVDLVGSLATGQEKQSPGEQKQEREEEESAVVHKTPFARAVAIVKTLPVFADNSKLRMRSFAYLKQPNVTCDNARLFLDIPEDDMEAFLLEELGESI